LYFGNAIMYNCTIVPNRMPRRTRPEKAQPVSWNIEKLPIGGSESEPVEAEAFLYTEQERSQFDMHYGLELGVVLDGVMDRYYLSGRQEYGLGQVWLCGMWEPHGWGVRTVPCRVLVFFLYPPLLARTHFPEADHVNWMAPFLVSPQQRPQVPEHRRQATAELAGSWLEASFAKPSLQKVALRLTALQVLLTLLDAWDSASAARKWSSRELQCLGRAMQIALQSPRLITAQEAARRCGLNRNALHDLFVEYMGISFSEFALRYRVSSAASQLRDPEEPLKALAARWGFTDASHLFRCFRKYYGCSPTAYRKSHM
jgi:AraC-like DNA-binding protein